MNARDYKIFRPNCYYHIFNRGNNKELIFLDDQDYINFLKRIKFVLFGPQVVRFENRIRITQLPENSIEILCYCLMPNHFHFLIKENSNTGINRFITSISTSFAKYLNKKYNRVGNVFQDTFKAKLVEDDEYLKLLSAYIHQNPANPEQYQYSSFMDYLGLRKGVICKKDLILEMFNNNLDAYKKYVLNFYIDKQKLVKNYTFEH